MKRKRVYLSQQQQTTKTLTMKTSNETNGATTYFTKTIDVVTIGGIIAQLTLSRKLIEVTEEPAKTKTVYTVTYKGNEVSSYDLSCKNEVRYFLNHLDKYADRIAASSY